jgi:hypothetical protein
MWLRPHAQALDSLNDSEAHWGTRNNSEALLQYMHKENVLA